MGLMRKPLHQRRPIFDPMVRDALQADVRSRSKQPLLQILAESVVDGESDHERRNTGRNTGNGDSGDDADKRLPALGAEVAGGDEEFEAHEELAVDVRRRTL